MNRADLEQKKQWLNRYKLNNNKIARMQERLEALESRITGIGSAKITGMPRGGIPVDTADLLSDKAELERRIQRLRDKGALYRGEILGAIDDLSDERLVEILECHFVESLSIDRISEDLGYTSRHTWRLYSQAIEAIEIPELETDPTTDD